MTNNVVLADRNVQSVTPATLLQLAVENGADIDKLEKLMNLQDRWNADNAKRDYNQSLAKFQAELGPIIKSRQGHNSKYADIDDIAQAIRPILDNHGLSYTFQQEQSEAGLKVICTVRHISGHSEYNSLTAPNDTSGGKNAIQAIASTVTYLRRYTLTGALGITTGNDDDDGGKPAFGTQDLIEYLTLVRDEFPSLSVVKESLVNGDFSAAKEAWGELDQETQKRLWRAQTKGSILSTLERTQMKSDDWSKA